MIPPRRRQPQEDNIDSWLMSYADMITLLLVFFVIFVSVSEPKKEKFSAAIESMKEKFGSVDLSTPFTGVYRTLQATIEEQQILKDVAVTRSEYAIQLELASNVFFKEGTADLDPDATGILADMAAAIKKIDFLDYTIVVEGHTNDLPVTSPKYPSNWELSAARAAAVVRFFADHGIKPEKMSAVGYADTRPKVPNTDATGSAIVENRAKNRRVIITLERLH